MATTDQQRAYPSLADLRKGPSQVLVKADVADSNTLTQILAVPSLSRSRSVPAAFRRRDGTAVVKEQSRGIKKTAEEELSDLERRIAFLQTRQQQYDEFAAKPRATRRPDSRLERAAFLRRVEEVAGTSELKEDVQQRIDMYESVVAQKAQQRHFEWTKRVYEPITHAISSSVDQKITSISDTRRKAFDEFLRATATKRGLFLADKLSDYDPYSVARSTIRVAVPVEGVDPTITGLVRDRREKAVLDPSLNTAEAKRAKMKDMLEPHMFSEQAMKGTVHGHFETQDAKRAVGDFTLAYGGKDTLSHVQFDDYNSRPLSMTAKGRVAEVDAEFPRGKRVEGYLHNSRATGEYLRHRSSQAVYGTEDGVMRDSFLDDKSEVRTSVTAPKIAELNQRTPYGHVECLRREYSMSAQEFKYH